MIIERPPFLFRKLFPGAFFRLPEKKKVPGSVYLTFDDGPIPEVTPWVLDILDEFGVKATFFMVGQNAERYPWLVEEVKKRGHGIGNHTLHHIRGLNISVEEYRRDVDGCPPSMASQLFRPPHGWMSRTQLKDMQKDYKVIMYDLITRDYSKRKNSQDVVNNVKRFARNGSIIVFHDSLKSRKNLIEALPESLKWLKEKGFEIKLL